MDVLETSLIVAIYGARTLPPSWAKLKQSVEVQHTRNMSLRSIWIVCATIADVNLECPNHDIDPRFGVTAFFQCGQGMPQAHARLREEEVTAMLQLLFDVVFSQQLAKSVNWGSTHGG